jgi:hypothetical protein
MIRALRATTETSARMAATRPDRLRAADDVEDEVACFPHDPEPDGVVVHQGVEQLEGATGAERLAGALDQGDVRVRVAVDGEPDVGELPVDVEADAVEAGPVQGDPEHAVGRPVEGQAREVVLVRVRHGSEPTSTGLLGRVDTRGVAR